jgi:hypothetical protein
MSQEHVDIVRRWFKAYNRRDIDGLIALSDPERKTALQWRFARSCTVLQTAVGSRGDWI